MSSEVRSLRFDLLHVFGIGRLLRWKWGRLVFQLPLLALALLLVYDGLTGPRLASENLATVVAWVHYRGLVILALLFFGNLFCMSCPFTLPCCSSRSRWKCAGRQVSVAEDAGVRMSTDSPSRAFVLD